MYESESVSVCVCLCMSLSLCVSVCVSVRVSSRVQLCPLHCSPLSTSWGTAELSPEPALPTREKAP